MEYLKSHPQISDTIAQGFAHIYHQQPQFPITFLANYLKSYNTQKYEKQQLIQKISSNEKKCLQLQKQKQNKCRDQKAKQEAIVYKQEEQQAFKFKIKEAQHHDHVLSQFCEWIEQRKKLTGVYIGEMESQWKNIDLQKEDSEQAHIDAQAPKVIKFKASSPSHHKLMNGKQLPLQSVVGKLFNEKQEQPAEGEEAQQKQKKPKGQIYISKVEENKDLHFFKYPKLGSFYAVVMRIKSYYDEKLFDGNLAKIEIYRKVNEEYQKQRQERQNKFNAEYDEKNNSGSEAKELEEMQANYDKQESEIQKPILEALEFVQRNFVVCFDTLGQDRQITAEQRQYCKQNVEYLRACWQENERNTLQKDIDNQLKVIAENNENPQAEIMTKMIEEEDRDLPSSEQVSEKSKGNEKLAELQTNTLRIDKIKEYIAQQKNLSFLDQLLSKTILKNSEILKLFLISIGYKKEDICHKGTNILNWIKIKKQLTNKLILQKINTFIPRGSKPTVEVQPYAKWQRISKCAQKYDVTTISAYNLFLGFILRFVQIAGKVRVADREARRQFAKSQNEQRQQRIQQQQKREQDKEDKMKEAKQDAESKEQPFQEQAWLLTYAESQQGVEPIEIGEEIIQHSDNDLEDDEIPPQETA